MATHPSAGLFTRADLDDFPDDGCRYELIDGELFVSPLARRDHQLVVGRIARRIDEWADEHGGLVYPGVNVELASDTHLEPDVAWSASEDSSGMGFDVAPEFVVEVVSPTTKKFDRAEKLVRYALRGASEIWIADRDEQTIEVFAVTDGKASDPVSHGAGDTFTSPLFDDLVLDVSDLLCLD